MATEQEELKLVLTLVDNISPGIDKVRKSLKDLGEGGGEGGGGSHKHIEKVNEGAKALTETILKMTGSFGEAFKALGMLRLGFLGGVAGVAAFGYEMRESLKSLGEYADKMRNIGFAAKTMGVDRVQLKNITDQLAVVGVEAGEATAKIETFTARMAELQRDPRVRMQILQQTDPANQANMSNWIKRLQDAGDDIRTQMNIAREMYENFERNARSQGQSREQAADTARRGMQMFGYDPKLARTEIEDLSAARKKVLQDANKDADQLATTYARIKSTLEDIADIQNRMYARVLNPAASGLHKFLEYLKESGERVEEAGGVRELYRQYLKDRQPTDFQGRWPNPNEQLTPWQGAPQILQKQSYNAIGMGGNPLFQQAAFGMGDHQKGIEANTEQLKQLNDLLRTAMGVDSGGTAGGGGFQNASYTPGGGGGRGRGFGSAEYPNLGGGGGGAVPRALGGGGGGGGGGGAAAPGADAATLPQGSLQGINRGWARAELAAKPWLREHLRRIVMAENPHPGAMNAVIESAMNRAEMQGISLEQALKTGAPAVAGAYYPHAGASPTGALKGQIDKAIDDALEGSDVSKGATDNSSGWLARKNERTGAFGTTYQSHGESFEIPGGTGLRGGRRAYDKWRARKEREIAEAKGAKVSSTHLEAVPWLKDYGQYREEMDRGSFPGNIPAEGGEYDPKTGNATGLTKQSLLDSYRRRMDADSKTQVEGTGTLRVHVNAPKNTNVSAAGGGLFKNVETYRQTQMEKAEPGPEMSSGMPLP